MALAGRLVVAFGFLILTLATPVTRAEAASAKQPLQDFGACIAGGGKARVLLLLDTSASLKTSDPVATRVDAARHLTDRLGTFTKASGAALEVAVAGFAGDFKVSLPWTALDGAGKRDVATSVDKFRGRNTGWETDYWQALQGARTYLADGDADCKALVWLTDGMYDLDQRSTQQEKDDYGTTKPYAPDIRLTSAGSVERVERVGSRDLCRAGGVADAIRADGVTTVAIALQGQDQGDSNDFGLMSGVATRSKVDGGKCGDRDARGKGSFVLAEDVGDLFFAFDALSDPENLPKERTTPLCQGEVCPAGRHSFVTDRSISSVSVLGSADVKGFEAVFVTPAGERLTLAPGGSLKEERPGFELRASWSTDAVFSATLERGEAASWEGTWSVVFVDPAKTGRGKARTNIRLVSDLAPVWGQDDELVVGDESSLDVGLALGDGSRVEPKELQSNVSVGVLLDRGADGRSVLAEDLSAADLQKPVTVDLSKEGPGAGRLVLEMSLTTADPGGKGTELGPRTVSYPVTVQAPGEYPRVPGSIDFGRGDSVDAVDLPVRWKGGGCVWLASSQTDVLPSGVPGAALASTASDADTCAEDEIVLSLTPEEAGAGLLGGTVLLRALPADGPGDAIEIPVRFRYEMEPAPNETVRWGVFALVMALGLAIPVALLAAVKKHGAVLAGDGVAVAVLRGQVNESQSFLVGAAVPRHEHHVHVFADRQTSLIISDRLTLRVKFHPFALVTAPEVRADDAAYVTSQGHALPLAVRGNWVATLDPHAPGTGDVEVVLLMPISGQGIDAVLADARMKVPSAVAKLRGKHGHDAAPAAANSRANFDDEWGTPSSGATPNPTTASDVVDDDVW
nr:VWA domain-containing protein [Aeromicrobium duanguangcaii]